MLALPQGARPPQLRSLPSLPNATTEQESLSPSPNTPHGSQTTVDMTKKREKVGRGRGDLRAEGPARPPRPGPQAHTPNSEGTEAAQAKKLSRTPQSHQSDPWRCEDIRLC